MSRTDRMFEIIQLLRAAKAPLTAAAMASALEVTKRTVYRDVAALQAQRVPIVGEAGIGYVMRPGYDLPPLMFDAEEIEAIVVALSVLGRTGDAGLVAAAMQVRRKIAEALPDASQQRFGEPGLYASTWHSLTAASVDMSLLRGAIRREQGLYLHYHDSQGLLTRRFVKPLAVIYYIEVAVLAAWCELRQDFRHFRIDRIAHCKLSGKDFIGKGHALRQTWRTLHRLP